MFLHSSSGIPAGGFFMRESQPVSNRGFATTRWSVVLAAGSDDRDDARTALAELCAAYWRPLFEYARRRGFNSDDAADRTQSFFADLITRQTVQKADEQRGRFRTFLLTAFQRFLLNEYDRSQAEIKTSSPLNSFARSLRCRYGRRIARPPNWLLNADGRRRSSIESSNC